MTRLRRQTNQAEGNHNSPMLGDDHEDFFNSIGQIPKSPSWLLCQLPPPAADMTLHRPSPLCADFVAKVANCPALIFLL